MHNYKQFIIYFLFFVSISIYANSSGLEISLAGDMIYDQGLNSNSSAEEKLLMRGAEIMFYSPLDHQFDGVLSAAAHDEAGETVFELHELNFSSNKIIPKSSFKIGQFFLGIGRLNQFHQHDWPFIRAPEVHEVFFASEGVYDSGVEYNYLFPTDKFIELTIGLTSGYRYGHSHSAGAKPKAPTHYARLSTFHEYSSTSGLAIGLNFLSRTDEQKIKTTIVGIDLAEKYRTGKKLDSLLQSEIWFRNVKSPTSKTSEQIGLYVFKQYGLTENMLIGARLDGFKDLSKINALTGKKINNIEYGSSIELTYKSSEFVTLRSGLTHTFTREEGETSERDTKLELQFVFILGSHPAHKF